MNIAVIPARGGSKRIPRKNVREFCGKPMIAWPIEALHASGCFDRIVVSTDDAEIASIARSFGAETPFSRPQLLADDHATTLDVMEHAARMLAEGSEEPKLLCCIYATTPFLDASDIVAGRDALVNSDADYSLSLARFEAPIQRALKLHPNGRMEMFDPTLQKVRSQDLEPAFHDAGQFYWGRTSAWLAMKPILAPGSIGVIVPRERAQDIDLPADWAWCERLFKLMRSSPC